MRKIFFRASAFAGLAMSALALASCGNSKEVELKDLDGSSVKIAATEDVEAVSKALVLTSKNALSEAQEKIYALEADLGLNGNLSVTGLNGLTFSTELNGTAKAAISIGKNKYTRVENPEEVTEEKLKQLETEFFNNIKFQLEAEGSIKFTDIQIDEKHPLYFGLDSEILEKDKEALAKVKGQSATAKARAFIYEGYGYTEVDTEAPKELISFSPSEGEYHDDWDNFFHMYEKSDLHNMGGMALVMSNLFADYQEFSISELLEKDGALISQAFGDLPISAETLAPVLDFANVDKKFYESEAYQTIKAVVETLGVSITKVENGNVTFAVDVNEKEIPALAKKLNVAAMTGVTNLDSILSLVFSGEKSLLGLSLSLDALTGRVTNVTVTMDNIDRVVTLLNAAEQSLPYMIRSFLPNEASGNLKLSLDFKYNDAVKIDAEPNPELTYVDTNQMK